MINIYTIISLSYDALFVSQVTNEAQGKSASARDDTSWPEAEVPLLPSDISLFANF